MTSDEELLQRYVAQRDAAAFEELVRRHIGMVYEAAQRMVGQTDAQDVTQAAFAILSQKAGTVARQGHVAGWLHRTAGFCAANVRRMRARRARHEREGGMMREAEDKTEVGALAHDLDEGLGRLAEGEREAVLLRYLEGRSVAETAAVLGVSAEAAGKRAGRGLEKLRGFFARRGYAVGSAAVVAGILDSQAAHAVPEAVVARALAGGQGAVGIGTAAIIKGVLDMMWWAKMKVAALVCVGAIMLAVAGGVWMSRMVRAQTPGATVAVTTGPATIASGDAQTQRLEKCWGDLEGMEPGVSRAMLELAGTPGETVAFLKGKVVPLTISASEVRAAIKDLGSDQESVWRPAFEKLEYFDPRLAIGLTTLLDEVKEQPARNRLVAVLSWKPEAILDRMEGTTIILRPIGSSKVDYNFASETKSAKGDVVGMSWWAESQVGRLTNDQIMEKKKWARADRALLLLAQIGTPDALEMVKAMAGGHPDAEPTKMAKEVLAGSAGAATQPSEKQMEQWWADMEKPGLAGLRAMLSFSGKPADAVRFFKGRLLPLKITEAEVNSLVGALGSEKEEEWKAAFEKLEYFDPRLAVGLEALLEDVEDGPRRMRLVEVLCDAPAATRPGVKIALKRYARDDYNFYDGKSSWRAESIVSRLNEQNNLVSKKQWQRAARAIVLLGHIGTPEALGMIKEMATGHPDAQPTRVAKEELAGR